MAAEREMVLVIVEDGLANIYATKGVDTLLIDKDVQSDEELDEQRELITFNWRAEFEEALETHEL